MDKDKQKEAAKLLSSLSIRYPLSFELGKKGGAQSNEIGHHL